MKKIGKQNQNRAMGGGPAEVKWRGIEANPNGNREERRAAKKLRRSSDRSTFTPPK